MSETKVQYSGGVGLPGLLFLVFLVLKLTGHITWSWWWVTAPLWGTFLFVIGIFTIVAIFAALMEVSRK